LRPVVTDRIFQLTSLLLLLTVSAIQAGDDEIRVEQIKPAVRGDTLTVSAAFLNLFSEKIVGTIQSGLPSIIDIEIKLTDSRKKKTALSFSRTLQYDIWNEQYFVDDGDSIQTFSDFKTVQKNYSRLDFYPVSVLSPISGSLEYLIEFSVAIVPITTRQADKFSNWLLDPNQTEENVASDNRAGGFKMNLNKLVSFFVSGKKRSRYRSQWHSLKFKLEDIRP